MMSFSGLPATQAWLWGCLWSQAAACLCPLPPTTPLLTVLDSTHPPGPGPGWAQLSHLLPSALPPIMLLSLPECLFLRVCVTRFCLPLTTSGVCSLHGEFTLPPCSVSLFPMTRLAFCLETMCLPALPTC